MQIQRCLSHAYKRSMQVTGGIPEGNATLIDNIYAEPACSDKWKEVGLPGRAALRVSCVRSAWLLAPLSSCSLQGHVCFSVCLFRLESLWSSMEDIADLISELNTTCSDFCDMPVRKLDHACTSSMH